jgi:hypothetical protein
MARRRSITSLALGAAPRSRGGSPCGPAPAAARPAVALCTSRSVALRRCFVALGFVAAFIAICLAAASAAASWVMAAVVAACCAIPAGAVVILELVPALAALRSETASAVRRHAIRRLRDELDALPETSHPLDA